MLVIHDWTGCRITPAALLEDLATMGYVAFAADIYGKGVRPTDAEGASAEAGKYKATCRCCGSGVQAGLEQLLREARRRAKTAAIGFCFGGTTALELARSGADLAGAVSFHGGLDSPMPATEKT